MKRNGAEMPAPLVGDAFYIYLCNSWNGTKKDKDAFMEELQALLNEPETASMQNLLTLFGKHYKISDNALNRAEAAVQLLPLRLYALAGLGDLHAELTDERLQTFKNRWEGSFRLVCSSRSGQPSGAQTLNNLSDVELEAFASLWQEGHNREISEFAACFPELEELYFNCLFEREELSVSDENVRTAFDRLKKYKREPALLSIRLDFAIEKEDEKEAGDTALLFYEVFLRHHYAGAWEEAADALSRYLQLVDGRHAQREYGLREYLQHEKKAFSNLPATAGIALVGLVHGRPKMKWTDERIKYMYQLLIRGLTLPDAARMLTQDRWIEELYFWCEELVETRTLLEGKMLQSCLSNLLLFASLRLEEEEARKQFRLLLTFVKNHDFFKDDNNEKSLYNQLEENYDIGRIGTDSRFSPAFRKAVLTMHDDGEAMGIVYQETISAPEKGKLLAEEYPYISNSLQEFLAEAAMTLRESYEDAVNTSDDEFAYPFGKPYVREKKKIGRNEPCPCGSGKKFKNCCMGKGIYD